LNTDNVVILCRPQSPKTEAEAKAKGRRMMEDWAAGRETSFELSPEEIAAIEAEAYEVEGFVLHPQLVSPEEIAEGHRILAQWNAETEASQPEPRPRALGADAVDPDSLHTVHRFQPRPPQDKEPNGADAEPPPGWSQAPPIGEAVETLRPNFRTLAEFCAEFRPISYAVAGLMRDGSLYTITARTGEGKTTLLVILALAIATGRGELIGRKVKKGRVAFCTAENPDDLRMRFMVACFVFNIDPEIIGRDILISDNRVKPEEIVAWIKETGETFILIAIDTWQAFFDGRDPNNNAEAQKFTSRFRPLAAGKGLPVVIIAAHPPKQAADDALLPYGGGSTLNEVDGNFTLLRDENGLYRFHHLGKIRGMPFDPLYFKIERLGSPDVITIEGAQVKMPVMYPVDEEAVETRQETFARRNAALLKAIFLDPTGSERKWAAAANMNRRSVQAALNTLKRDRLVIQKARRWRLTKEGERMAKEASENDRATKGPCENE
jgi:hypothetical protein